MNLFTEILDLRAIIEMGELWSLDIWRPVRCVAVNEENSSSFSALLTFDQNSSKLAMPLEGRSRREEELHALRLARPRHGPRGRAEPSQRSPRRAVRQTLQGSFSAVSKPNFVSKDSLESSRRDLHNALLCTDLQSQFFVNLFY